MNICLTMVVECTKKGLFECLWSTTSSVMNMEDWYACKKCPCELKAAAAWPWFFLFILHPVLWGGADKAFAVLWVPCPATCTLWHQHSIHKDKQCKEAISVCGADRGLMKTLHSTCFKYSQVPHAKVSDAKWCEGNEEWRWWCTCTYMHGGVCALSMALQTASSFLHPCPQGEPSCTTDTWLWVLVSDSLSCGQG